MKKATRKPEQPELDIPEFQPLPHLGETQVKQDEITAQSKRTTASSISKPFIATPWKKRPKKAGKVPGKRLTVPKQAQGLKGMMARYNVGISPRGYEPIRNENEETLEVVIDPRRLDYVDIDHLKDQTIAEINYHNAKLEELTQNAKKAAKEQQEKEFERQLREKIKAEQAVKP